MEDRTYIKLFRKMLKWEWYCDTNTFRVFMHILLKAQYNPSKYKGVDIGPGECVFGRKKWAEDLGLSEQQVRTALSHLQSTNEITIKSTNKFSVIHIVKWEFWQIDEGKSTNESTNKINGIQPTSNQQVTTYKESKNIRNKELLSYAENEVEKTGWDGKWTYADPETGRIRFNIDQARKDRGV